MFLFHQMFCFQTELRMTNIKFPLLIFSLKIDFFFFLNTVGFWKKGPDWLHQLYVFWEKDCEKTPDFYIWMSDMYGSHLKIKIDKLISFKAA